MYKSSLNFLKECKQCKSIWRIIFTYPIEAIESGIQEVVCIKFLVKKLGEIEQLKIVRGVDDLLQNEAKRVTLFMLKWVHGEQAGEK